MKFLDHGAFSIDPPSLFREGTLFQKKNGSELSVYAGGVANFTNGPTASQAKPFVDNNFHTFIPSNGSWSSQDIGLIAPYAPQHGAATQASEGLAFYLNGVVGDKTTREAHPWMIVFDLHQKKARNVSTSTISPAGARVGATLQYVAELGEKGALILIGGGVIPLRGSTQELGDTLVRATAPKAVSQKLLTEICKGAT